MRIAHLADLHIGFRQYERSAPGGKNQREADVAAALTRVVDDLLVTRPDLVLIAGDVFHQVRPPNGAIQTLFTELARLRQGLPQTRVVCIAGDHDTPRSVETDFILPLYRALGVDVAFHTILRVHLLGHTVWAVPKLASGQLASCWPEPGVRNVLLAHGEARPDFAFGEHLNPDALAREWDYVALGHYHVHQQVGPRAWYAGAIEYASTDIWAEARTGVPKGYLLLELGQDPIFRPIPTRQVLDLEPIDAQGLGATEIDAAIAARTAAVPDGAVARLIVTNISRLTKRALDYAAIRAVKTRALHFELDCRRPEAEAPTTAARLKRMQTLDQIVDAFLGARELPPDVERAELQRLGALYMQNAEGLPDPYTGEVTLPAKAG